MNSTWLSNLFSAGDFLQAILVLSLICAIGLALGKINVKGTSLGVSCVFFVGIAAGQLGLKVDPQMLSLAQNFGLVLFVYVLGLQVGPSFFPSFRQGGLRLNLLAICVLVTGLLLSFVLVPLTGIEYPAIMGLFSGAVTNTPMLGAAQQTLLQMEPSAVDESNTMAMACAVGYPFGILGMMLCIVILKHISKKHSYHSHPLENRTFVSEFEVCNPAIFGKSIRDIIRDVDFHVVISRIWQNEEVILPDGDTELFEGEHVLALTSEEEVQKAELLFGRRVAKDWNRQGIDWNAIDSRLISRQILVSKPDCNGRKLSDMHLRNLYGINVTRVNRAGIDFFPSGSMCIQTGDRLTIVGEPASIDKVSEILGNQVKELRNPNLLSIFAGIIFGLLLGSIPIFIPGISLPVRIGIAGGPIIAGILMGAYGSRFHFATFTTPSANMMLRQMGITVYLAGLGLSAGPGFIETVMRPEGLVWIALSLVLAIVPVLLVGIFAAASGKLSFSSNIGLLCGAMANPFALTYGLSLVEDDEPSVAYATVYPVSMFLRVILAQLAILLML